MGEQTNGRIKVDPTVAIQIVAWIVAALMTYGAINARVAVIETRQGDIDNRMQRMEQKIDRLLERP